MGNGISGDKRMKIQNKYVTADRHRQKYYRMPTIWINKNNPEWYYQCYAACAADEICDRLLHNMDANPLDVLNDYRELCLDAACNAQNGDINFMFSVAADVAEDFINLYLSMNNL